MPSGQMNLRRPLRTALICLLTLPAVAQTTSPMEKAEKVFAAGDLRGAIALYDQAAHAKPTLYEAPLYAGDAAYKLADYPKAKQYFDHAIAIDPDRETAHRFLGETLLKMGHTEAAEDPFLDSIVAEPYIKATRIGLKHWADTAHAHLIDLPIQLPPRPPGRAWGPARFRAAYPQETLYRHSLAEEIEQIRALLTAAGPSPSPDPNLHSLQLLDHDGMIESWILLDHWDQGVTQDYPAYRATHRDLLRAYMKKYVVHLPGSGS